MFGASWEISFVVIITKNMMVFIVGIHFGKNCWGGFMSRSVNVLNALARGASVSSSKFNNFLLESLFILWSE